MRVFLIVLFLSTTSLIAVSASANDHAPVSAQQPSREADSVPEVVLYVLPECGYCEKARQLLTRHGVEWREVDIQNSAAGKKTFTALGGVGTPLLVIGEQTVQGYDASRIESLLAQAGAISP